jgi:hypothetical protein
MGPIVELTCEPLVGAKAEIIRETGTGELVVSLMHNAGRAWPSGAHVQMPPNSKNRRGATAMTINELIERLEDYRDEVGGDAEVRLMTQSNWPFENTIFGLCSTDEIRDASESEDEPDDDVLYIVEGTQLGYGTKTAWTAAS